MHESISFHVLASGSKGNTSVVVNQATGQSILIDCGCRKMDLSSFFLETGCDPAKLEGVLITHDHNDHIKSLAMLMRYLRNCGADPLVHTLEALIAPCRKKTDTDKGPLAEYNAIRFDETIEIAGLDVTPLPTSHDATASCGFFISSREPLEGPFDSHDALTYVTDTGILPAESAQMISHARLIALESNHDEKMLRYGDYPRFLKERIASDVGHLSNAQASDLIRRYVNRDCQAIVAMHLSKENNLPSLAREALQGALDEMGLAPQLRIASQCSRVSVG